MKRLFRRPVLACAVAASLAACQNVRTQSDVEPQVITIRSGQTQRTEAPVAAPTMGTPEETATPAATPTPPTPAKPKRKISYNSVAVDGPYLAMTFDDGPHPELTPRLLDLLKERGIKATFYVVGKCVDAYPQIMKRMVQEGHEVGHHTYTHPALNKISAAKFQSEMDRTTEAIVKVTGEKPSTIRPPYGATNATINRKLSEEYGMTVIMWSVDPLDWKYRNSTRVANEIIAGAKPGAIILAHDIHASTVAAMPAALDTLLAKGYRFVTVSELLDMEKPPAQPASSSTPSNPTPPASGDPAIRE